MRISSLRGRTLSLICGMVLPVAIAFAQGANAVPGRSSTLLPDGRLLLLGGESSGLPQTGAIVENPRDGARSVLPGGLKQARAWHTAALLPSGAVLVLGGVGVDGRILASPEVLDPVTGTSSPFQMPGFEPRAFHTATLLTDGRVLIAGGRSQSGQVLDSLVLWDYRTNVATPVDGGMKIAREKHTATLLPDGNVLFRGGTDSHGTPVDSDEVFDPELEETTLQQTSAAAETAGLPLRLEASLPQDGAADVSLDAIFGFRFSRPLDPWTANRQTVTLEGPDGVVPSKIVPAEDGMLLFVVAETGLLPSTEYQITLSGLAAGDERLPDATLSFTTAGSPLSVPGLGFDVETSNPGHGSGLPADQSSPPLQAPDGVTAVSGTVLRTNGSPLRNVTLTIGTQSARTDASGRFLLSSVPDGHQVLVIDGTTASTAAAAFGVFEAGLELDAGKTNVLPYTIWMTKLDTAHVATIPSPTKTETILTSPLLPGLELHLPPSAVIYDRNWNPVTKIGITPIALNRPPFPLPNVRVPIYFTIQPGGAWITVQNPKEPQGGWLVYPNTYHSAPGSRYDFWNYDVSGKGWYIYGHGTVTPDGKKIVPDKGVLIYGFTGAMVGSPSLAASVFSALGNAFGLGGDPVDLSTGLLVMNKTDLYLPDIIPINLTRTYRQQDSISRAFGIGTTHIYDMFLIGDTFPWTYADLVLPDGEQVYYKRISPGTDYSNAVYENTSGPTIFYGSMMSFNGVGWNLVLKDGTTLIFPDGISASVPQQAALIGIIDRYGNSLQIVRDPNTANLLSITSPSGRWVQFTYDSSNRVIQAADNAGRTVTYSYNSGGRLAQVTDAAGGMTTYTYDSSNDMLTFTDARGVVYLKSEYDSHQRVSSQTLANGGVYRFAYTVNPAGQIAQTKVTDPLGMVREVTFNSAGYTATDTKAVGTPEEQKTSFRWQTGTNLLLGYTDALGRTTDFAYDSKGNVTRVTQLAGTSEAAASSFVHEPMFSRVISTTDPLNHTSTFSYDTAGDLVKEVNPLGSIWTASFNGAGQPVSMTNPLGDTTEISYSNGDLSSLKDPLGNSFTRRTDGAGVAVNSTDALGNSTQMSYNPMNQPTSIVDAADGVMRFDYDADGNRVRITDPLNHTNSFTYDSLDRLISRTDPLGRTEKYEYDPVGNTTKYIDRRGDTRTFAYDGLNRVTSETFVQSGKTTSTIDYTYDAGNRVTKIVDSRSGTIERTYNDLNEITSESSPEGKISYAYDLVGRRTSMTVKGQPTVSYDYDDDNRLTRITQGGTKVVFTYDAAGRRASLTLQNGVVGAYAYDEASRLTAITYTKGGATVGNLTYAYDGDGRRIKVGGSLVNIALPSAVSSATYNDANELTHWGSTKLTYDENGNLAGDGTTTYTWNDRNQLAQVAVSGVPAAKFQYDSLSRRIGYSTAASTNSYLYDGINIVQEHSATEINWLTGLWADQVFSGTDSTGTVSFLTDALNSNVALTDSAGSIQTAYSYSAFGDNTSSGASSVNPFQFTGRENDGTGLYYYRARYYSPAFGRFISEDPLRFGGGDINLYAYAHNNPTNFTDPTGRQFLPGCIAGGLIGAGAYDLYSAMSGTKATASGYFGAAAGGCALGSGAAALGVALGVAGSAATGLGGLGAIGDTAVGDAAIADAAPAANAAADASAGGPAAADAAASDASASNAAADSAASDPALADTQPGGNVPAPYTADPSTPPLPANLNWSTWEQLLQANPPGSPGYGTVIDWGWQLSWQGWTGPLVW